MVAGAAMSNPKTPPPPPPPAGSVNVAATGNKVSVSMNPNSAAAASASAIAAAASAAAAQKAEDPIERARRGVVQLERNGEVLGLGTVLKNDGRILTALSPLGDGNSLDIRYADGSVTKGRVGHSERLWDLALVVPQVGKWPEGLSASDADPLTSGAQLRAFTPGKNKANPASVVLKGKRSLLGADDTLLRDVFEVGTKIGPKEFGSPIIDEHGSVVGLLGRACVPVEKGPCAPTAFGVPVSAAKSFLRNAPANAVPPAPWLGIQGVAETASHAKGVRVKSISPDSPADEGGLKGGSDGSGDVIVAVDDQPVSSPEALSSTIREKAVGERVKLLLLRNGKFKESTIVLKPAPAQK